MATEASKKKRAVKVVYHKVTSQLRGLIEHQIYPGDTIGVHQTPRVQVGDPIVIWNPTSRAWNLGVWQGRARNQFKIGTCLDDGKPYTHYYPSDEWEIYGRIVEVDAFFDLEYFEEIPNGTTNISGIAESDLVM